MQLITHKLIPASTLPVLPSEKVGRYQYCLGVRFCPSIDLLATYPILTRINKAGTGTEDGQSRSSDDESAIDQQQNTQQYGYDDEDEGSVNIDIWRFNGQRVFSIAIENDQSTQLEATCIEWRNDGRILAVLTSDNYIRLVNSFSGKVIHRFSATASHAIPTSPTSPRTRRSISKATESANVKTSTLSYSTHFRDPQSTRSLLQKANEEKSTELDDLLSLNADITSLLKTPANLPREIASIDVESFLPRLSCLPPIGYGGEDVFSTRASIDAIFHSSKKNMKSGTVDVLVTGSNNGLVTVRIFDSFEVGGIDLNSAAGMSKVLRIGQTLSIATWPFSSETYVVAQDATKTNLHLLGLDLRFITHGSNTLPVLATKATQLQNLLRYLTQIQAQLAREIKTAYDLPTKYLRNLTEDLEAQDGTGASFATAAYHAIVTGEVSGAFKEWLNDQLGDRGVKRWEKGVSDCLDLVRRLVSEAWCPTIERAGVVISRLNGLSGWQPQSDTDGLELGLDRKVVEGLRDTVDVMAICGEACLRDVIKEINGFASFIRWLKLEVEASGLEDTSERLEEMREASDHADISKVLEYINQGPHESAVKKYLTSPMVNASTEQEDEASVYTRFKEQRQRNGDAHHVAFDQSLIRMKSQCDSIFEQIATKLRQTVMMRYITPLSADLDQSNMDLRLIPQGSSYTVDGQVYLHIIARHNKDSTKVVQQTIDVQNIHTKPIPVTSSIQKLPDDNELLDVKFVDDESYMALARTESSTNIYSRRVDASHDNEWELRHEFKDSVMESGMKPARFEINGRKKRRVVGVIDETGKGFVILDLDSGEQEERGETEDEVMTG